MNSFRLISPSFAHRPAPCRADAPTIAHPLTRINLTTGLQARMGRARLGSQRRPGGQVWPETAIGELGGGILEWRHLVFSPCGTEQRHSGSR
jgi:hypothetical protein